MNRILTFFIILLILNNFIFCEDIQLNIQRINVDFKGIVKSNNSILLYGTGSIVLKSINNGNSWKQILTVDDSLDIIKMQYINSMFLGMLNNGFFIKSVDEGENWKICNVLNKENIIDFDVNNDFIFVLYNNYLNIFDYEFKSFKVFKIDSIFTTQKVSLFNEEVFIACDSGKIIRYNIYSDVVSYIDLKKSGLCKECKKNSYFKLIDTNFFYCIDGNILKYYNNLGNWSRIAGYYSIWNYYNNFYYELSSFKDYYKNASYPVFRKYLGEEYSEIISVDTVIRYIADINFSEFYFISQDTILAVGKNKLIYFSYNGGKDWELKSNLSIYGGYINMKSMHWLNKDTGFVVYNYGQVFKTFNGGVTWLPQIYTDDNITKLESYHFIYIDTNGKGFVFYNTTLQNTMNYLSTNDFGETFFIKENDDFSGYHLTNRPYIFKLDDLYYFFYTGSTLSNYFTLIYVLDSSYNSINRIVTDSMQVLNAHYNTNTGIFTGLGIERKCSNMNNVNRFDSINYYYLESYDKGHNWEKIIKFHFDEYFIDSYILDTTIIFTTLQKKLLDSAKVLYLSVYYLFILNRSMDSPFLIKTDSNSVMEGLWVNDTKLYCGGKECYFKTNYEFNNFDLEKHRIPNYIFSEEVWHNNSVVYAMGAYTNILPFSPNMIKFTLKSNTDINEELKIKTQLYNFNPFPIPAKDYVIIEIFWDLRYDIKQTEISVYNLYGFCIENNENISIDIKENYRGFLKWNCSLVQSGIYFIRIKHGDAIRNIPVLIKR